MRVAAALAWLAAMAVSAAQGAANIDSDGFVQDGETTYCDGVTSARGALVFENLKTTSAGKCPLTVAITASVKSFSSGDTQAQVTWSAALSTTSAASSLFPRAVNSTTGLPRDVIASLLRACKAGSNCATDSDVVVPATVAGGTETATGAFDKSGKKTLRQYQFKFPSAGSYVIVGKVVLPGDPVLNISATEFVSFQKVQVSSNGVPVAGTVKPADQSPFADTWVESNRANITPEPSQTTSATKAQLDVQAQDSKDSSLTSSSSDQKSGSNANVIVLGSIAGLGFIIAVAYFATSKNEKKPNNSHDAVLGNDGAVGDDGVYRLTDMGKDSVQQMPAFGVPKQQQQAPVQHHQHKYQPQQQPAPWKSTPPMAAPMAPAPHQQQHGSFDGHDSFDGMSDFGSIIGSEMMQSQMTSFSDSMFNSLHDSQVALPPQKPKKVRASSLSSLGDLDDSDEEFYDGGASEIYSDASQFQAAKGTTSFHPTDTQASSYSWLDRDSETDLTDTMHERLTKEYDQI